MGQITSVQSDYQAPLYLSKGLIVSKIQLSSLDHTSKKLLKVDQTSQQIILPKSPLSKFTQNERESEWQYLLNVDSTDSVDIHLKVSEEVLKEFKSIETESVTIYNNLKVKFYDDKYNTTKEKILASKVLLNNKETKSTMDPNVIEITENANEFRLSFDFDDLLKYGKTYIAIVGSTEDIIKVPIFISHNPSQLSRANVRPTYKDSLLEYIEDGPEFRAQTVKLEDQINQFRILLKTLIKKAQVVDESSRNLALARSSFSSSLSDLTQYASFIENSVMAELVNDLIPILTERSKRDIDESNVLTRNLLSPMVLIYNSDMKLFNNKRKLFSDQAKDFYTWLCKHQQSPGSSHTNKRLNFELSRFDYFIYLNEFKNGYPIRNLLYNFALFLQEFDPSQYSEAVNTNISKAVYYYQHFAKYRAAQQQYKNSLSTTTSFKPLPEPFVHEMGHHHHHHHHHQLQQDQKHQPTNNIASAHSSPPRSVASSRPSTPSGPQNITKSSPTIKKTGVLYTLGGQGKSGWHKQYLSLKDNLLSEYIDWKEGQKLRGSPIDLTFSFIKSIDTLKDRKFCIEIITPMNIKRIFQTESEVERESWMQAFSSAASLKADDNQFNRSNSTRSNKTSRSKDDILVSRQSSKRVSTAKRLSYNPQMASSSDLLNKTPMTAPSLLAFVHDIDLSNRICCDCGTLKSVEWISLNLLVVVCIDCSGVHRSLGTHVSKMRSLTLDNKSFTSREIQELLYHVSNKFANTYWEHGLVPKDKITPLSTNEERKIFITNKYANKKFISPDPLFKPNEALIKGVHNANIALILKALAYGANTSMVVIKEIHGERKEVSLFEYSLTHFHGTEEDPIFDVSQLLLLNNTPVTSKESNVLDLNDKQTEFWTSKIDGGFVAERSKSVQFTSSSSVQDLKPQKAATAPSASGLQRSKSMLLKRSSSTKFSPTTKRDSIDVAKPKDKSNRMSRFKMLGFNRSTSN